MVSHKCFVQKKQSYSFHQSSHKQLFNLRTLSYLCDDKRLFEVNNEGLVLRLPKKINVLSLKSVYDSTTFHDFSYHLYYTIYVTNTCHLAIMLDK